MLTGNNDHDPVRDRAGKFANDPEVARRDAAAMEMRAKGARFQDIADALGYSSRTHAFVAIQRGYERVLTPGAKALRAAVDDQLDELTARVVAVMDADHLKVSAGSTVFDPTTGDLMRDDAPILAAADRILRIIERRAKLHGLDAPTKVQAQVQAVRITVDGAEDV